MLLSHLKLVVCVWRTDPFLIRAEQGFSKFVLLAEGPSPFKPHMNGLILIAVALVLSAKTMMSLFRNAIWVSTLPRLFNFLVCHIATFVMKIARGSVY